MKCGGPAARMAILASSLFSATLCAADRLVLRNLDIISSQTVDRVDPDGAHLADGRTIGWDAIEQGRVSPAMQAEFDRLLKDLGEPLYRIRQRLSVGDVQSLLDYAEAVYPSFRQRRSRTAYMVCQALMWARLAHGRREPAVEPYLRCFAYLRGRTADEIALPGRRRLRFDEQTGLTPELPPVWFDPAAARAALPGVFQAVSEMPPPRPEGTRIYYGTLALSAGDRERGLQVLQGIQSDYPVLLQLRDIASAQMEVEAGRPGPAIQRLAAEYETLDKQNKPLACYWLGIANSRSDDPRVRNRGVLQLLRLPGLYGELYPDLAAAGLYHSMQAFQRSGNAEAQASVRRELLTEYPQTYHAAAVRQELSPKRDP